MKSLQLLLWTGMCMFLAGEPLKASQNQENPRVVVLTDIENEPDDAQSLVRFLTYVNHFRRIVIKVNQGVENSSNTTGNLWL